MKRICFLLLAIATIGTSLFAQTSSDPEAKKILDAVSEKFRSFKVRVTRPGLLAFTLSTKTS